MFVKNIKSFLLMLFFINTVKCNVKTSLVFAIDNTGSMGDDIDQVIEASVEILRIAVEDKLSKIDNFVLVTFNDPEIKTVAVTKDPDEYYRALKSLQVDGGDDCPEMALAGIERAIEESMPGSFIYVFTDASAKDFDRVEDVKKLAHKKQSKVIFLLTGMCVNEGRGTVPYQVYHDVAAVSSGQVFHLRKDEVAKVLKSVSLLITGNSSVLTSKHLPEGCHVVDFRVDSKTTDVSISVSGEDVIVADVTGDNINSVIQETIVETSDVFIKKLHGPNPGNYSITLCSRIGSTVMIAGVTDLDFQYGFSTHIPNSLAETDIQPTIGRKCRVAIELSNPEDDIELNVVEILDLFENFLFELPCKMERNNFYVTEEIMPPNETFKIAVVGRDKTAGTPVRRISKTAIQPIKPPVPEMLAPPAPAAPKLDKSTTLGRVNPGTSIIMECPLLQGNPKPKITWYYKLRGSSDYEEIKHVGDTFPLLVNGLDNNAVYRCNADNDEGHDFREFVLRVNQRPFITKPKQTTTKAAVGKLVELPCKVRGEPKPAVKWMRKGKEITGGKYKVSKDNTLSFIAEASDTDKFQCVATNVAGTSKRNINVTINS